MQLACLLRGKAQKEKNKNSRQCCQLSDGKGLLSFTGRMGRSKEERP